MGVSIYEFQIAMEIYGAERLEDVQGSRYNVMVPRFNIKDVYFSHSGSYYIVQRNNKVPENIMSKAMAEFSEEAPGGYNYWYDEIHSVRGLLTLALMLEDKYSRERLDELVNETYGKLFKCDLIQHNTEVVLEGLHSPKMQEICQLLGEYDNLVNPFGNSDLELREPSEYLNNIIAGIAIKENYANVCLSTLNKRVETTFSINQESWHYGFGFSDSVTGMNINITHYFNDKTENYPADEIVALYVYTHRKKCDDIDMRLSLKSGMIWKTSGDDKPKFVSEKQLDIIINYLKESIESIKQKIISQMIVNEENS